MESIEINPDKGFGLASYLRRGGKLVFVKNHQLKAQQYHNSFFLIFSSGRKGAKKWSKKHKYLLKLLRVTSTRTTLIEDNKARTVKKGLDISKAGI